MGAGSLINLHTHTRYSDGDFFPEEVVTRAADDGLTHIAITDHFETTKIRCLSSNAFSDYLSVIRSLQKKFKGGIDVLAGVEIDTNPARCDLGGLPFEKLNELDLVLFEYVSDPVCGGIGLDDLEEILSQISVPCGLAHTDIQRIFGERGPEETAELIASYGLFVEINTAYLYKREGSYFFELAERFFQEFRGRVRISVGTDVHHSLSEISNLRTAYGFIRRTGLETDLLF